MGKYDHLPLADRGPLKVPYVGNTLLNDRYLNKGTAFTHKERHGLGLNGLLPTNLQNLDEQVKRAYEQYSTFETDLEKNTFMTSLAEQNTVLYYRLILDHLTEMSSIIYTPTEGDAIENYSRIFRKPDGCFLPISHPQEVEDRLRRFVNPDKEDGGVDYIVVSDGEQILGIGDQGIGGILISVAKLALTTVCAGIHPDRTLGVVLDTGTDSKKLLEDDLYLGLKHERVRGDKYDEFVDNFVQSAKKLFPKAYIHFEDFGVHNARRLLDRYRKQYAVFNDDVQGTGCVTLSSIMAATKLSNIKLGDIRVISFGAGSAGTGKQALSSTRFAANIVQELQNKLRQVSLAIKVFRRKKQCNKFIWSTNKVFYSTTTTRCPLRRNPLHTKPQNSLRKTWIRRTSNHSLKRSSLTSSSVHPPKPVPLPKMQSVKWQNMSINP